jgi:hypothetical protein
MRAILLAGLLGLATAAHAGFCPRFPDKASSAYDATAKKIKLRWRTDLPSTIPVVQHAWEAPGIGFETDWRGYIAAVMSEIKASGIAIKNNKITMPASSPWWITPWMDYTRTGRDPLIGLTTERGPDPGDLSPTSTAGHSALAIGWYNAEGAASLKEIFSDPCDPKVPQLASGARWTFKPQTAAFKLLFTDAPASEVAYLAGAPTVRAMVAGKATTLRLIQVDIAVRDPRATQTSWVFGTYVWVGPARGDELFDNLEPVGLMWGNDPGVQANVLAAFAPLQQSKLNEALAGKVWQANGSGWPQRPYPGFQGRLNGPADNWRSSCLACHASAQYPRDVQLGAPPRGVKATDSLTPAEISAKFAPYFVNVQSGHLINPQADQTTPLPAAPLDYSLQLQTAFSRICQACARGDLTGATPSLCKLASPPIEATSCPAKTVVPSPLHKALFRAKGNLDEALPRQ